MNLESASSKKSLVQQTEDLSLDEFDFKPITSGLGFHHAKAADVKPAFTDKVIHTPVPTPVSTPAQAPRKEMSVYQNDLSLFYQANQSAPVMMTPPAQPVVEEKIETTYVLAKRATRVVAYLMDLFVIASVLGLVLTVMARSISMDLMEVWTSFPHEITPLVLVLFAGFYLIYFSIFEKWPGSTLGKNLMGIRVVNLTHEPQTFNALFLRSIITLTNFLSLGLFAWFDLQNKVTQSKMIRAE